MKLIIDYMFQPNELREMTKHLYHFRLHNSSNEKWIQEFENQFQIEYNLVFDQLDIDKNLLLLLTKYYRNEYCIKAHFLQHLNRSKARTNYMELPIQSSRTDLFSIFHGKSETYEIKTKYDNLNRLSKQIDDYSKCFEYIYIVCEKNKLEAVKQMVPKYCGIYTYDDQKDKISFSKIREALTHNELDLKVMLNELWKSEKKEYFPSLSDEEILLYKSNSINSCFKKSIQRRYVDRWSSLQSSLEII